MARDTYRAVRRTAAFALIFVAATGVAEARGRDDVVGTRSDKLVETSHEATVTLDRGHARVRVRRTVFNGGPRHDQAMFFIVPPPGGVAVGLKTAGVVDGRTRWFAGELMEAEAAAEKYRELTGIGGYYPKDPALLSWRSQEQLALQVFPCAPAQPKTVEYTFVVPTEYRDGAHHYAMPAFGTAQRVAGVTLTSGNPFDRLEVDGKPVAPGARVKLDPGREVDLALVPNNPSQVGGALAERALGPDRVLTRFRVEAAPRLSEIPRNAHVVVALDTSRSMEGTAEAQLAAARAYLSHYPDARVQLMTFDRSTHLQSRGFEPVGVARRTLANTKPVFANGSQVDDALREADFALSRIVGASPRRIVLFTDARTRSTLTPEKVAAAVRRSGAVVHVGVVSSGSPALERDDDHAWAGSLRPTGGLVWRASASASEPQRMAEVYEELVRPMRIDRLAVETPAVAASEIAQPESLPEGQGLTHLDVAERPSGVVHVRGELWASPARWSLRTDAGESKLWSALVFGSSILYELSEAEMMPLAMHGGAVSPVTSYLAIEPGVRPSTEGLDWGSGSGGGIGLGGLGLRGTGVGGGGFANTFDPVAWLRAELSARWAKCGGSPGSASVELETTLHEVVDVAAVRHEGSARMTRCLREAAWDLSLPFAFRWPRRSWSVRV